MALSGELMINGLRLCGEEQAFSAMEAESGNALPPLFHEASPAQIDQACQCAAQAFNAYAQRDLPLRARFLRQIGDNILAIGDALIDRAMQETALPRGRIEGERARTIGQLNMFADVVERGEFLAPIIETALPERKPLPRPDLRQRQVALGPVAVFGASNFPLAFSVAGGDSASALAAGCPVVVKAHPAHPGTSEMVGQAIVDAVKQCQLPPGVFALLHGTSHHSGQALVSHPAIQAVGFTGSRNAGLALVRCAQQRQRPIPVYAEMSSINPLLLFPTALAQRSASIAQGYVDSLVLGTGQFCTNPGIALALDSPALENFCQLTAEALAQKPATTMLTPAIQRACQQNSEALAALSGVRLLGAGQPAATPHQTQAQVYLTDADTFLAQPAMQNEIFGPVSLLVRCQDEAVLQSVIETIEGQLTFTLQLNEPDYPLARTLLPHIEARTGRIIINGYPTGVDVGYAMVHGGPFPATSDARSTSVGATAIQRFLRPVCYQDFPTALLPFPLASHS